MDNNNEQKYHQSKQITLNLVQEGNVTVNFIPKYIHDALINEHNTLIKEYDRILNENAKFKHEINTTYSLNSKFAETIRVREFEIEELKITNKELEKLNKQLNDEIEYLKKENEEFKKIILEQNKKINELNNTVNNLSKDINELKKRNESIIIREGFVALEKYIMLEILQSKKKIRGFNGIQDLFKDNRYQNECNKYLVDKNITIDHINIISELKDNLAITMLDDPQDADDIKLTKELLDLLQKYNNIEQNGDWIIKKP
jgi:FtsZ-binding cell division protein ZapB